MLGGHVRLNSFFSDPNWAPTATRGGSANTWWPMFCFTWSCPLTRRRRNRVTRTVFRESASTDPACVTEDGSEICASTAREGSSK